MNTLIVESLRALRMAVTAYETANTAVCNAQIAARTAGVMPSVDMAEVIQREMRSASKEFRAAYKAAADTMNETDAEQLHKAVWA